MGCDLKSGSFEAGLRRGERREVGSYGAHLRRARPPKISRPMVLKERDEDGHGMMETCRRAKILHFSEIFIFLPLKSFLKQ